MKTHTPYASCIARQFSKLLRFYTHFGAGFIAGAIYVAILMTTPQLAKAILILAGRAL